MNPRRTVHVNFRRSADLTHRFRRHKRFQSPEQSRENGWRCHFREPERQEAVRACVVVAVLSAGMFPDRRTCWYDYIALALCPLHDTRIRA